MRRAFSPYFQDSMRGYALILLVFLLMPVAAYAQAYYVPPSQFQSCSSGVANWMVISRVVVCVEGSIRLAMITYLTTLSDFLKPTITALFIFSMILLGIRISAGVEDLNKEIMMYIVRFGFTAWFCINLGGFQHVPFDIMHYASALVVGGWDPWAQIDLYMGRFFGFGDQSGPKLFQGLIGLAMAAMFSGIAGILVFIMAMLAMVSTLYFGFRAVYSYLAAILLISFVILISPLIVPLAIFEHTNQRYVKKWLDFLIAGMIHPVLLFAFLWMFLGTFNYMLDWFIHGVFQGNTDFSQYWRSNRNLFSWLMTADPATMSVLENTIGQETNRAAVQSFMSPSLSTAVEANPMNTFTLDFGAEQVWKLQLMTFGFLGIFIVSYLMLSMVNKLPEVADAITGVVTGLTLEGIPFATEMRQALSKMKGALGK